MKQDVKIPEPTIKRLADYLHLLLHYKQNAIEHVSSTNIAKELAIDSIQVRKDVEYTNVKGKPKAGYVVGELIEGIEKSLNWNYTNIAFLVGAGHLGKAIMEIQAKTTYGLQIIDAFDDNPQTIGTHFRGIEVHPLSLLVQIARQVNNKVGILAVSDGKAQKAAEMMQQAGINAIWNFTNIIPKLNNDIIIETMSIAHSLALFTTKLQIQQNKLKSLN